MDCLNGIEDLPSFLRLARNISKHSTFKIKMGAVLASNGHPISVGFNKTKYCSKYSHLQEQSLHAEMVCLKTSGKDYIGKSSIYVFRQTKNGEPAMAKPCKNCQKRLKEAGIETMIYSTPWYPYFEVRSL
jgi:deoxycytidylate deaminase